jgi:hypothetical protein
MFSRCRAESSNRLALADSLGWLCTRRSEQPVAAAQRAADVVVLARAVRLAAVGARQPGAVLVFVP